MLTHHRWLASTIAILTLLLTAVPVSSQPWRTVVRVIDGDTIELDGGEKASLIGVDTPELTDSRAPIAALARESRAFLLGLAEGKKVRLEYDQNRTDKLGRTLAYLFLEDATLVNAAIVKEGYSPAYVAYPFTRDKEFRSYERQARAEKRGLWAERLMPSAEQAQRTVASTRAGPQENVEQTVYVTRTGAKYHRAGCRYLRRSSIPMSLKNAVERFGPCSVCRPPMP